MVHMMYKQYARPLARVVHGLPTLWEPVVATVFHKEFCGSVTWSICNRFIAVTKLGVVEIRDAVTLNLLSTFNSPRKYITEQLSFSPDGHFLTEFCYEDHFTYDLQTGCSVGPLLSKELYVDHPDFSAAYSMDGKMLAAVYVDHPHENTFIATHDLSTMQRHLYCVSEGHIISPIWTHSEFLQFVTVKPGYIVVWKVKFNLAHIPEMVESLSVPEEITGAKEFLFLPPLSRLAVALHDTLLVWDVQDSKYLLRISPFHANGMSFSSNGHFFASSSTNPPPKPGPPTTPATRSKQPAPHPKKHPLKICHPERSLTQLHRVRRSRRTCGCRYSCLSLLFVIP